VRDDTQTRAQQLLDRHPGLREVVEALPEFQAWSKALPKVLIDGETFSVVGGDQLKDHNQTIIEWVGQFRPELLGGRE
jgi:hypothetical protein